MGRLEHGPGIVDWLIVAGAFLVVAVVVRFVFYLSERQ